MKCATLRRIEWVGYFAFDRPALRLGRPELGHGVKQHARIGMKGTAEQFPRRGDLNDAAQIHDATRLAMWHHREVVTDQKITQAQAIRRSRIKLALAAEPRRQALRSVITQ